MSLIWDSDDSLPATMPLSLFNGGPAPTALKDFYLWGIPVDLGPMHLLKLSFLQLIIASNVMMQDILSVLRNCPTLLKLQLEHLECLRVPEESIEAPILLESLITCAFHLPIPLIRFLLLAIQTSSLHQLKLSCDFEDYIPTPPLFASPITSFGPTLPRLISTAKPINIRFDDSNSASITFGTLQIPLNPLGPGAFLYLRDVLDSLMGYIGERGNDLTVHLDLDAVDPTMEELQIFNKSPMVGELTVREKIWSDLFQ
ncbi:hypothetical protein FS837_012141 [Tulasnella sp. UAMH 9824]|nr:hypothetical protein FS837_012141 [Tulasnella sp. UAMH 9824]